MRIRICLIQICLALSLSAVAAGEEEIIGWRTDGTGLFPDANPPTVWEHRTESILKLKTQAGKPKDADTGTPMADGVIREWLVLGPVPLPEGFKSFKKEILPGEAAMEATEGEAYKDLTWKKVTIDTACLSFKSLFGADRVAKGSPVLVAYAQAWIHSETQQSIYLNQMAAGKNAVAWLNGKPVAVKHARSVTLNPGWNRLAYRVVSNPAAKGSGPSDSWYIRPVLFGAAGGPYRTKNIAWSTRMPGQGYGGPILVKDRLFVTADVSNLLCVDKNSGKVLWIRSNTCFDALPEDKRKSDAEEIKEAAELQAQLLSLNQEYLSQPDRDDKWIASKIKLEAKIHRAMKQKIFRCEVGSAANTPVSDGKHIYALFANCVLACYDLEGNRKWITHTEREAGEHGQPSSPVIAGDKVIISLSSSMLAFDKETGRLLWETSLRYQNKGSVTTWKYYSTPLVFKQNAKEYLFTPRGQLIRAEDGKSLYFEAYKAGISRDSCSSPLWHNGLIYLAGSKVKTLRFVEITDEGAKPEITSITPVPTRPFPRFYGGRHMATPLIHEGLMYCLSIDGLLSVIDLKTREIVYQKVLDLDLNVSHQGSPIRAGIASSPALGGKYIYLFGNQGAALVIKPGRTYEQVAKNRIEYIVYPKHWRVHQEVTITCPVFEQNRIYIRGEANLYCLQAEG